MAHQRSTGRRTDYTWQGASASATMPGNTTQVIEIAIANVAATLYRTRGEIVASIDGPVADDKTLVTFGIIVATEEDLVVGATALPNPKDDMDAEWLWHGFVPLLAQGAGDEVSAAGRLTVDSKAMRCMKQTQSVVLVTDVETLAGTPAIDFVAGFRVLFGE